MRLFFSFLGFAFVVAIGALALTSTAFVAAIFLADFPVGWAVGCSLLAFFLARGGWRQLIRKESWEPGVCNNAEAGYVLWHVGALATLFVLLFSPFLYALSAWWMLTFPLVGFVGLLFVWCCEAVLNVINPAGRRG